MNRISPRVFAYDISKDKIRRRVYKILKAWRIDGQKSVHECRLTSAQAQDLFIQLGEQIDPRTDLLLMAKIESHRKILTRGTGKNLVGRTMWHLG